MFKRTTLFLRTNLAVLVLFGIVTNIVLPLFGFQLGNTNGLLVMAAAFGVGGAFISLLMSKWIARITTGARVITEPRDAGAGRNNALVAVSIGLLGAMDRDEASAVLGHGISHVATETW